MNGLARERELLFAQALITAVPFVALAIWARFWSPAAWEPGVLNSLAQQPGVLETITSGINVLGNPPIWAIFLAVSAGLIAIPRGTAAGIAVAFTFASDFVASFVKVLVERPRPDTAAVLQFFGADSFSYPSGHVVRAVSFAAVAMWLLAPRHIRLRLAVGAGVIAWLVMGYARVALGVHWPTDTFGGLLLGMTWFALTGIVLVTRDLAAGRGARPSVAKSRTRVAQRRL